MNILFITPYYYPHIGGVEKHIKKVTAELARDGHRVVILVIEECGGAGHEQSDGIEVFRLRKNRRLGRVFILYQILKLRRLLLKAEIIQFHDFVVFWKYGTWLFPALKLLGKRLYITFHGWEGRFPPDKKTVRKRKICERLVDGNICVGRFIEKWYGTKADIVSYGGVDKADRPGSAGQYAVFVGRLAEDSGIKEYIEAWKKINRKHAGLRLVVCGDGPLKEELLELVEREGIENVEFKGFVSEPERYVRDACVVFTSGYLGILEAFSYKKPVIGTYNHQLKKDYLELLPESGSMLWIAGNSDEIYASVEEALKDKKKIEAAYRFANANSWTKVKNDYYSLWKR